jgi:adenylosuccinate lyase
MIPRHARPQMTAVWKAETRFRIWFEIEAYACDALAEIGVVPKEAAAAIWGQLGSQAWIIHSRWRKAA